MKIKPNVLLLFKSKLNAGHFQIFHISLSVVLELMNNNFKILLFRESNQKEKFDIKR